MSKPDSGSGAVVELPEYGTATIFPLDIECGATHLTDAKYRAGDEDACSNSARYVAVLDGAAMGRCGKHVSDYWLDVIAGIEEADNGAIMDLVETECDARTTSTSAGGLVNPTEVATASSLCTFTPRMRVVQPDQDGFPPKNFCGLHARDSWLAAVREWRTGDDDDE